MRHSYLRAKTSVLVVTVLLATLFGGAVTANAVQKNTKASAAKTAKAKAAATARAHATARSRMLKMPAQKRNFSIVSYNVFYPRMAHAAGRAQAKRDMAKLTSNPQIDIIGLQEAHTSQAVWRKFFAARGWGIYAPGGSNENPIAWRKSRFLPMKIGNHKAKASWLMSRADLRSNKPYGDRHLNRVLLWDRLAKRSVAVYNTHVTHFTEKYGLPRNHRNWRAAESHLDKLRWHLGRSPADITLLTGDFNIDAKWDARRKHREMPRAELWPVAKSSYTLLGFPKHHTSYQQQPHRKAWIDYIWLRNGNKAGAKMTGHYVMSGLLHKRKHQSDHAPLRAIIDYR